MESNLLNNNVTLIIWGKINTELINKYLSDYYNNYIIISTSPSEPWVNSVNLKLVNYNKHSIILNMTEPSDKFEGFNNLYEHIQNIYIAINSISTKYAIILRGDEYFSNLSYVYKKIELARHLYCSPIFFKPKSLHPYHISDHLIAGTVNNLKIMFNTCYENFSAQDLPLTYESEIYITTNYIYKKYNKDMFVFNEKIISPEIVMKNHFAILDLNEMKPYTLVSPQIGKVWNDNFIPEENNSISKMEDY